MLFTIRAHCLHAAHHVTPDFGRVVDDDGEAAQRLLAERADDEAAHVLEIGGAVARAGEHHGKGLLAVGGIQQDADQVQDLLRGAGAARKNDDAVREPDEGFEAFLDVRHDRQVGSRSDSAARTR